MDSEILYNKFIIYLKRYDVEFYELISKFDTNYNKKIFNELKSRIKNFSEFKEYSIFFYNDSLVPELDLMINEKMKITDIDIVKK
jgi:hypothetical protein